jgi:hypothetical protein
MERGTRILLLLMMYGICDASIEIISVTDAKPSNSGPSVSFSMPLQYSMAAPELASAQLAAASLTSIGPSQKTVTATQSPIIVPSESDWIPKSFSQRSKPFPDILNQQVNSRHPYNRKISFSAGYSVSEPQFESHKEYLPQYQHKPVTYSTFKEAKYPNIHQGYPSGYESYISYTPPPSYEHQQYYQDTPYAKPYFLKHFRPYSSHGNDLIDFPSHEGALGENSSSYYKFMFPLALLGLSIPAMGLMYTYLSRRRRRDLNSEFEQYFRPSTDDLQYYLDVLQNGLKRFQENLDNKEVLKQ